MVVFVSFVEKRTYPLQHPLQKLLMSFWGGFILAFLFFFFLILLTPPPPPPPVNKIYVKCPQEQNKTEEVKRRKKRRKEEGKSKALQLSVQQALSFEVFFFLSQHTCTDSQPAALLLFKTAPHQNLNAR